MGTKTKKLVSMLSAMLCIAALASCGGGTAEVDTAKMAQGLSEQVTFSEQLNELSSNVLIKRYGIDESIIEDAAGYAGTKAVVDEIAVFKTTDTDAVNEKVTAHIASQTENYTSYAPNEVPKLEDAVVENVGDTVIVCISDDDSSSVKAKISELTD